jgi:hypothetical protein
MLHLKQRCSRDITPLINYKEEHGRSRLYIFALWIVEKGNSNHNHFEGEITSYKNVWIAFAKKDVFEGGKF